MNRHIAFLLERFEKSAEQDALVWNEQTFSYGELLKRCSDFRGLLEEQRIPRGSVVSLEADFGVHSVAALFALVDHGCTLVPIASGTEAQKTHLRSVAEVEWKLALAHEESRPTFVSTGTVATHPILAKLKADGRPGLILFSSGSTGVQKAAVHDFSRLLKKFEHRRKPTRMLSFLLFDHIGGINTMLHCLSNGGCLITVKDRMPATVAHAVQKYQVQVLPTSPTFLNLFLMSGAHEQFDLKSLELITYGTEPMPSNTLERLHKAFPDIKLQQTYGLSEVGILRSKSQANDSLYVKIGGEGFETRIVDGLLEIKADSAMLGYLNAPSPFTEDGWFKTGDLVEVQGEYIKILGRKSEMINVGGLKVFPAEVENVLQQMENVEEVSVYGEKNPLTGSMVAAAIKLRVAEEPVAFRKRLREFCKGRLDSYKVPQRIQLIEDSLHSDRFKKIRPGEKQLNP